CIPLGAYSDASCLFTVAPGSALPTCTSVGSQTEVGANGAASHICVGVSYRKRGKSEKVEMLVA
ncbi:MAG: hypothetical protein ACP5IE_09495, partial [Infirmifilum sp.]